MYTRQCRAESKTPLGSAAVIDFYFSSDRMLYLILFAFPEYVVLSNSHCLHDKLHSLQVDVTIFSQVALQKKHRF